MLLRIETTHRPATDLGYLLHKNPAGLQSFEQRFGMVHVFYPVAGEDRCQVCVLLDVDPVGLVRGRGERSLDQYVNDRPYVASSFLSVALNRLFSTAINGRSKERPELVERSLPLKATIAVVPSRGGEDLLHRLFEPLGSRCAACTSASSGCWLWRVSRSIRGCDDVLRRGVCVPAPSVMLKRRTACACHPVVTARRVGVLRR